MTLSRRCATAVAVVTVAGPITHPTCGYRPSDGAARRHAPPSARTRRAPSSPEVRTQSPGARLRVEADPTGTTASAEPVNSRERPGLRKSWTRAVHSLRVSR